MQISTIGSFTKTNMLWRYRFFNPSTKNLNAMGMVVSTTNSDVVMKFVVYKNHGLEQEITKFWGTMNG